MLVEIYPIETVRRAAARSYSLGVGVGVAAMSGNVEVSFWQILINQLTQVIENLDQGGMTNGVWAKNKHTIWHCSEVLVFIMSVS